MARNSTTTAIKLKCVSKTLDIPTSFDFCGQSNLYYRITTQTNNATSRQQFSQNNSCEFVNKSPYATVAPGLDSAAIMNSNRSSKFHVHFGEGPTISTLDNIVQQVESIPADVQKERGYQIIGKVKASDDALKNILALGDMRV